MSPLPAEIHILRTTSETVTGQLETLGSKVECLEMHAEGNEYDSENDIEVDESANSHKDSSPDAISIATGDESFRPVRNTRRTAASVLANHGRGKMPKTTPN